MHVDIMPDDSLAANFVEKNPVDIGVQCVQEMSEHEINTERYETEPRGEATPRDGSLGTTTTTESPPGLDAKSVEMRNVIAAMKNRK